MDSGAANDHYREGDEGAVTHILYRVIENRATTNTDQISDAIRDAILADTTQRTSGIERYLTTTYYYQDVVYAVTEDGRHEQDMPAPTGIDATTRCYWVTAWLGVDDENILAGYDTTP